MGIASPFILDNYYVWFKNNLLASGPLYDDVRFEPLSGNRDGKYFVVTLDYPPAKAKWALFTERYGFGTPEFVCGNVREMIQHVDNLGAELEQGAPSPLIAEEKAAAAYIAGQPDLKGFSDLHRISDHTFSIFHPGRANGATHLTVTRLLLHLMFTAAGCAWAILLHCKFGGGFVLMTAVLYLLRSHKGVSFGLGALIGLIYATAPLGFVPVAMCGGQRRNMGRWGKYAYAMMTEKPIGTTISQRMLLFLISQIWMARIALRNSDMPFKSYQKWQFIYTLLNLGTI